MRRIFHRAKALVVIACCAFGLFNMGSAAGALSKIENSLTVTPNEYTGIHTSMKIAASGNFDWVHFPLPYTTDFVISIPADNMERPLTSSTNMSGTWNFIANDPEIGGIKSHQLKKGTFWVLTGNKLYWNGTAQGKNCGLPLADARAGQESGPWATSNSRGSPAFAASRYTGAICRIV